MRGGLRLESLGSECLGLKVEGGGFEALPLRMRAIAAVRLCVITSKEKWRHT